jgi:hypothetical protein
MDRIAREGVTRNELDWLETDALRRRAAAVRVTVQRIPSIFAIFQTGLPAAGGRQRLGKARAWVTSEDVRRVAQK